MKRGRYRFIMGRHCIEEVLRASPERLITVYCTKEKQQDPLHQELLKKGVAISYLPKQKLSSLMKSESHQSFVAEVKEKHTLLLKEFLERSAVRSNSAVLALDTINDPQNLGALLRSAECFGVDAVTFSKNRGVGITAVASKASAGATELVEILRVSNLAEAIKRFKDREYTIIATAASSEAVSLYSYDFPPKFLLILGSEGRGIQKLLMRFVDVCLKIPMCGRIGSLNVSQAAAVTLSHWRRKNP